MKKPDAEFYDRLNELVKNSTSKLDSFDFHNDELSVTLAAEALEIKEKQYIYNTSSRGCSRLRR